MPHHFPKNPKIAVIGLGYVGLPLAIEFARKYPVIGFDIDTRRIAALEDGMDVTREIESSDLKGSNMRFSSNPEDIADSDIYIVTVPTPIDRAKCPDLGPLRSASRQVGKLLGPGNIVIYESTVYPGCTEEDCVPILERESGLSCALEPTQDSELARETSATVSADSNLPKKSQSGTEFFVGYSPERINPGDKAHRLPTIKKVTSGCTPAAADYIDQLYATIITAGTHKASSIKVAEAAKIIENTQRDVNIALVNELAMLFAELEIDTGEVLEAASTKWNFLPFKPGLVGGHCIGVDPYYLTYKAQQVGFNPQMILAGRRTNDSMGAFVAGELIKLMAKEGCYFPGARVLILGLTFKEDCPDLRNTRVVDVIAALRKYRVDVDVHDPWASPEEAAVEYGIELVAVPERETYDAAMLCVAHREFQEPSKSRMQGWLKKESVIYDLKGILPLEIVRGRL